MQELHEVVDYFSERLNKDDKKNIKDQLMQAEDYLKSRYENNCTTDNSCSSHCAKHGLSNVNDSRLTATCSQTHNVVCYECYNIISIFPNLKSTTEKFLNNDEKQKSETIFKIDQAEQKIMSWQKHLLRSSQQSLAKKFVMNIVDNHPNSALLVRDWAQKIEPCFGIESQEQYYGKSGMSLHADVFMMKIDQEWKKYVYITAFDKTEQDAIDVFSITNAVAEHFLHDFPQIRNIYIKSDNAGCYHNASMVEGVKNILAKYKLNLARYDFNKPQKGKDCCDREFAYIKKKINTEVNCNPHAKIDNVKAVLEAIMQDGGLKNVRAIILKVDKKKSAIEPKVKIKNIKSFHSFVLTYNEMVAFEYFDIGAGISLGYKGLKFKNSTTKEGGWVISQRQGASILQAQNKSIYCCSVNSCTMTFQSEDALIDHELSGNHNCPAQTQHDKILDLFVTMKYSHVQAKLDALANFQRTELTESQKILFGEAYYQGWGRPEHKFNRFTEDQKKFVKDLFDLGEKIKTEKKKPEEIAKLMSKDERFSIQERLTPAQIRGLIQNFIKQKNTPEQNDEDELEDNVI